VDKVWTAGPGSLGVNKSGSVTHIFGALIINLASLSMDEYRKVDGKVTMRQESC